MSDQRCRSKPSGLWRQARTFAETSVRLTKSAALSRSIRLTSSASSEPMPFLSSWSLAYLRPLTPIELTTLLAISTSFGP